MGAWTSGSLRSTSASPARSTRGWSIRAKAASSADNAHYVSTTAVASDSTHVRAYDQNLFTEWHSRYGGRGVLIYWHVERKSLAIHSQLLTCTASEVAAMIEGAIRHGTSMDVEANYVDSHGQSEIGFGITRLLNFDLLPRIKRISDRDLQREIEEGLNVMESSNGANSVIAYGKGGELASNRRDEQEMFVLCLRILQSALVYVNTLMLQHVLAEPDWAALLTPAERRGLTPLFWTHVRPYGEVNLNMTARLDLTD